MFVKIAFFLIFTPSFSQTMIKQFLLGLEKQKELQPDVADTIEKENVNGIIPKPSTTHTAGKKVDDDWNVVLNYQDHK